MAELDEAKKSLYVDMINEKIAARKPFTAYDITRDVRSQGNAVEHYLYKEVVHDLFVNGQMDDYVRTLKQSPTGPCFLFHGPEFDASTYSIGKPRSAVLTPALPAPTYTPAAQAAAARNFGSTVADDDGEEEDNEPDDEAEEESANVSIAAPPDPFKSATGFPAPKPTIRKAGTVLYVPAPMGRHIGLQPGGEAFVMVDKAKEEVRIGKTTASAKKIHVDVNANLRVSVDILKQAGVGRTVRIGIDNGDIVITKAKVE